MNQTAAGVAPEQGALRPAQHLYPADIEQLPADRVHAADVRIVHKHGHGRFEVVHKVGLGYAAQIENGQLRRPGVQLQARRLLYDLGGIGYAQRGHLLAAERRHGNADILQVLRAFLRGNHHLLQNSGVSGGRA